MTNNDKGVLGLSRSLFWDVDPDTVDPEKHAAFIIDKVICLGTMEDFQIIKNYYGKPKIKRVTKKIRYMDDRELNFCSIYFNVPITQFRCYTTKQSNLTHWNY